MARKNTRKNRKNRKTMRGGSPINGAAPAMSNAPVATPATNATPATPTNNTSGNSTMTGGRRRKSRKMSSGADKWRAHMMKVYREMKSRNPATRLGDAMRAAKKSYK